MRIGSAPQPIIMGTRYFLLLMLILATAFLTVCSGNAIRKKLRRMKMTRPVQKRIDDFNYTSPRKQQKLSVKQVDEVLTEEDRMEIERNKVSTESPASGGGLVGKKKQIIGGIFSTRGQFPFLAGIDIDADFFCGGSLISLQYILTAGHCAHGSTNFEVYLGAKDRDSDETGRVYIATKKKFIHSKFNPNTLMNDVAIIGLGKKVQLSQYIKIIRLPAQPGNVNALVDTSVMVAGWGRTSDRVEEVSSILYHVKLKIRTQATCSQVYGYNSVFVTNLCAGSTNGQATCQGDSGGPMVMRDRDGAYTQIGIVSYGAATGCELGFPDVFTRVASYLPWITSTAEIVAENSSAQTSSSSSKKKTGHRGKTNQRKKKNKRAGVQKMNGKNQNN